MTPFGRCISALCCLGSLAIFFPAASGAELPTGKLLEKVVCSADPTQSYALYVPTTFDATRRWPVLFCFDPGARGRAPVERFMAAAEKLGYIVAGSNNSRNGPWEANARAITAMIKDVNGFFLLDSKRVYAAGLSGGARVACQIAVSGIAKGVVACSAGFVGSETPDKVPFPFFGTAGITDFNYLELRRVDRDLDDRRTPHRVVIHNGGHQWLPAELALEALTWLDLQAMRSGAKMKDEDWIKQQFDVRLAAVPAEPVGEKYRGLQSLVADFKGLTETATVEKNVAELAGSQEIKAWSKLERAFERREEQWHDELFASVNDEYVAGVRKTAAGIRAKAKASGDARERSMATRVLQGTFMTCSESARELMRTEDYSAAAPLLEMMTILNPDRPQPFFDLARARARLGDKKRALTALQQAVEAGFKDAVRVEQEAAFLPLRSEPAFLDLLGAMKRSVESTP